MPGPLDAYDNSAEELGLTQSPGQQADPGIVATVQAAMQQTRAIGQSNSRSYYEKDFYDDLAKQLNGLGYRFHQNTWFNKTVPFGLPGVSSPYSLLGYQGDVGSAAEDQMWAAVDAAHAAGQLKTIPNRADYEKSVAHRIASDVQQSSDVLSRASGVSGFVGATGGAIAQGLHDPAQLAMIPATEGVGALLDAGKAALPGLAGRVAGFVAPSTTGAGATGAVSFGLRTIGAMAREGTAFAGFNAALAPQLDANAQAAGTQPQGVAEQAEQGFKMGAGLALAGRVLGPGAKLVLNRASEAGQNVMARLYPNLPPAVQDFFASRMERAGTEAARGDLAEAAAAPGLATPPQADAVRTIAPSLIDAEVNPFVPGPHGEETHGQTLTGHRTVMNTDAPPPGPHSASYAAPAAGNLTPDSTIRFVINQLEGGSKVVHYGEADGGTTKYGIAAKDNPGIDVAGLSEAGAAAIARSKYWFPELNGAPPDVAAVAFDAGFISGPQVGKTILREANGSAERAIELYRDHLQHIAATVPGKAQYLKGWMNRVDRLQRFVGGHGGEAPIGGAGDLADADPQAELQGRLAELDRQQDTIDLEARQPPYPQIDPAMVHDEVPDMPVLSSPLDLPMTSRQFHPSELTTDAAAPVAADRTPWSQEMAGKATVFERADGSFEVMDGNQRLARAQQWLGTNPGADVRLDAIVLRAADGWSPETVRMAAALKNLAERGGGADLPPAMQRGLPRATAFVRQADGLARLGHAEFGAVLNHTLPIEEGAAIGHKGTIYEQAQNAEHPPGEPGPSAAAGGAGNGAGRAARPGPDATGRGGAAEGAPGDVPSAGQPERGTPDDAHARATSGTAAADHVAETFSDPHGAAAGEQLAMLKHDLMPEAKPEPGQGERAKAGEAPAKPKIGPPLDPLELAKLAAPDRFAVAGQEIVGGKLIGRPETTAEITRAIAADDAALAALKACL